MKQKLQKTNQRVIALLLVMVMLFGLFSTGDLITFAYEKQTGIIYTSDKISLTQTRKEPSDDAEGANKLRYGKPVTVINEVTGADGEKWYQITYDLKAGGTATAYCHAYNVLLNKDITVTANGMVNAENVSLRNDVGTDRTQVLVSLNSGHKLEILDSATAEDGKAWTRVRTTVGETVYIGWIYSAYVEEVLPEIEVDEEYKEYLIRIGFPESYVQSLAVLHALYPNWVFEPVLIGLDWATVIREESAAGRNLVHKSENDAKKSIAESEYDWRTNTWTVRDSSGWVTAHPNFIAYCMDPRNFLSATSIFMFEDLSFSSAHTIEGVTAILNNTFMMQEVENGDGTILNYANAFMEIGKAVGVSPYHLASRVRQEQGTGGKSPLISGTYPGYEGLYNYFNFGAYGTPNSVLYANGFKYAANKGWTTRYYALFGGSQMIAKNYIGVGQNTLYFQKFDVIAQGGLYNHQYMANVQAAISEAKSVAKAYTDKKQAFVFRIPVYENMPKEAVRFTESGNRNNYLASLEVSGLTLTPDFDGAKTEYSLIVDDEIFSITVSAKAVVSTSKVSGTGSYNLQMGENNIKIHCTSASGDVKTYTLTVVRQDIVTEPETPPSIEPPKEPDIPSTEPPKEPEKPVEPPKPSVTSTKYVMGSYVTGVEPNTTAADFIKGFVCENATIEVVTFTGEKNDGIVGTGNKIMIYSEGALIATKEIIVYGDVTGDGKVTALDAIRLNRYTIGTGTLSGCYLLAGDANRDGKINTLDAIVINRYTIGLSTIKQK